MKKEYKLVIGENGKQLSNKVTELLNEGFELYGSPFSASMADTFEFEVAASDHYSHNLCQERMGRSPEEDCPWIFR